MAWQKELPPPDEESRHLLNFIEAMKKLHTFFGKDYLAERVTQAYEHLEHVPDMWFDRIVQSIINNCDRIPVNLVRAFKEHYHMVTASAGASSKRHKRAWCEYCNANGHFTIVAKPNFKNVPYPACYTVRCTACENWRISLGDWIPAAYPLEMKTRPWVQEIQIYGKPADLPDEFMHLKAQGYPNWE